MHRRAISRHLLYTLCAVVAGLTSRALVEAVTHVRLPYMTFLPWIFLSGFVGGLWPALLTLGSFITLGALTLEPTTLVRTSSPLVGLSVFTSAGLLVCLTGVVFRREKSRAKAARDSDRLVRDLSDAMPQIVWAARPDGTLDYYNRRWFEFINVDPSVAPDDGVWSRHVHPDDLPDVTKRWSKSLRTGEPYSAEFRVRDGGGVYHWFLVRAEPVRDGRGAIKRWFGTCTDIDERRRAETRDRFLLALDEAVRPLTDPDTITAVHARLLGEHLSVDRCAYADVEADQNTFNLTGNFNRPGVKSIVGRYQFSDFGQEVLDLMRADEPYVVNDIDTHQRRPSSVDAYRLTTIQAVICVPLHKAGRFAAAMAVHQLVAREWTPDEVALVRHVAGRCWESIERSRVERDLHEREISLRRFVETANEGVLQLGADDRVIYSNDHHCRMLGYEPGETAGMNVLDFVFPEDRAFAAERRATRRERKQGEKYEIRLMGKDGREVWVLNSTVVITTSDGRYDGTYSMISDVTERRRALGALRVSEERLRLAQEAASVGTWELDLIHGEVFWSDGLWRLLGLQKREERLTFDHWTPFIHPDDRTWVLPAFQKAVEAKEREFYFEFRLIRADRVVRWVTSRGQVVYDSDGKPLKALGANQDITERKQTEEALLAGEARFRFLVDTIPHIVWSATPEGAQDFANRRWYEFTGVREGETSADAYRDIVHPDDLEKTAACWESAVRTGRPYECLHRVRKHDGEYRWVMSQAMPQRDDAGRIVRWFGTGTDVTEQHRSAEEREQLLASERAARTDAERAGRMKDEFLATLSHELRTPLNAIVGWATILTTGDAPDAADLHDGLSTILRNARAQTQIIEDLLDMSRIISGKIRLDVQRMDLAGVVQAALETVRPAASAKGIRIQSVLDPDAGPVSGDPNRLQQVFWNLLSNAVKFTPRDGRVHVVLERVNSHLEVSITDSGEGIRPEFLPYVFDRFRQADSSTTRRHGGLGLGLAIVKQLVELHGGSVRVKSPGEGQGSTFTIALPLTALKNDTPSSPTASEASTEPDASHECAPVKLTGVRVLVVDDEPDARALVCRLLEDCDATVLTAGSADEAVRRVLTDRPNVVVSDIGMPGEDGYALIRRLRALPPAQCGDTPAVALTAYARSEDRVRAIRAGFQSHLVKPVEPAELIAIVGSLAGKA